MNRFIDMLIKRLKEERFSVDVACCTSEEVVIYEDAIKIIYELAGEYNNGWIPCEVRLPNKEEYLKNDGRFIVTDGQRKYVTHFDIYEMQKFGVPQLNGFCEDGCVIAWMPLPETYKKEQSTFKVGDVIESIYSGRLGVITQIKENGKFVLFMDGMAGELAHDDIKKTGKHIDISELLQKIGGAE